MSDRLINRLMLPGQIFHWHAITALCRVRNPDANGIANIVRIARHIGFPVMDYHFVEIANVADGNSDVPNLLSTPIHEQKVCLTFNRRF